MRCKRAWAGPLPVVASTRRCIVLRNNKRPAPSAPWMCVVPAEVKRSDNDKKMEMGSIVEIWFCPVMGGTRSIPLPRQCGAPRPLPPTPRTRRCTPHCWRRCMLPLPPATSITAQRLRGRHTRGEWPSGHGGKACFTHSTCAFVLRFMPAFTSSYSLSLAW